MGLMTGLNMALACGVHSVMMDPIDWVSNPAFYLRAVTGVGGTSDGTRISPMRSWRIGCATANPSGVALGTSRGLVNCSERVATKASEDGFAHAIRRSRAARRCVLGLLRDGGDDVRADPRTLHGSEADYDRDGAGGIRRARSRRSPSCRWGGRSRE